ncbi:sarcocystatin-A-like [Haematobia irritans]|uniref:sarcocystatin-A-like n=1 Tax=Haematobia irritans TaxID=7368 RepID=UPI003F4F9864
MMKIAFVVVLAVLAVVKAEDVPCLGCESTLSPEKAAATLNNSLNKLTAGEGPHYKLVKINRASSQVVQGMYYRINADLMDEHNHTKTCDIDIVDFNDVKVTFKCPDEPEVQRTHA